MLFLQTTLVGFPTQLITTCNSSSRRSPLLDSDVTCIFMVYIHMHKMKHKHIFKRVNSIQYPSVPFSSLPCLSGSHTSSAGLELTAQVWTACAHTQRPVLSSVLPQGVCRGLGPRRVCCREGRASPVGEQGTQEDNRQPGSLGHDQAAGRGTEEGKRKRCAPDHSCRV